MRSDSSLSSDLSRTGFTLIELLIASVLTGILVSVAFIGILAILESRSKTEIVTKQEDTLNLSIDFIGDDIRTATLVNSISGPPKAADNAVAESKTDSDPSRGSFSPSLSASAGTYVLYLEIPMQGDTDPCPTGTALAGSSPPDFDRVLYDIRASSGTWQGPFEVYRYGRLPELDGEIDPCSSPTEQVLVEAIAEPPPTEPQAPSCDTVGGDILTGDNGFWACVDNTGNTVLIKLSSTIPNPNGGNPLAYSLETRLTPRLSN